MFDPKMISVLIAYLVSYFFFLLWLFLTSSFLLLFFMIFLLNFLSGYCLIFSIFVLFSFRLLGPFSSLGLFILVVFISFFFLVSFSLGYFNIQMSLMGCGVGVFIMVGGILCRWDFVYRLPFVYFCGSRNSFKVKHVYLCCSYVFLQVNIFRP